MEQKDSKSQSEPYHVPLSYIARHHMSSFKANGQLGASIRNCEFKGNCPTFNCSFVSLVTDFTSHFFSFWAPWVWSALSVWWARLSDFLNLYDKYPIRTVYLVKFSFTDIFKISCCCFSLERQIQRFFLELYISWIKQSGTL